MFEQAQSLISRYSVKIAVVGHTVGVTDSMLRRWRYDILSWTAYD